ncbi:hypothetical protein [Salipaludibacillus daqingensis]|uniref:hypothetical protein n=1 Tax=Salipaludibacillus daqingensis TaxID=3041001 RepID=UPI002473BEA0|nr:hypothetical protein [Salipaludibacillus daqingensis]
MKIEKTSHDSLVENYANEIPVLSKGKLVNHCMISGKVGETSEQKQMKRGN